MQAAKELERPLGQSAKPGRTQSPRTWRGRPLWLALGALCLVAVSSAIALRDKPFRIPVGLRDIEARNDRRRPPAPSVEDRGRRTGCQTGPGIR